MIKFVSIFELKEGSDPEKVWKYWVEKHAFNAFHTPGIGIKKYIINRVTKTVRGKPESKFWGMAEIWFESEEAYKRNLEMRPKDDFWQNFYDPRYSVFMEEKEIS